MQSSLLTFPVVYPDPVFNIAHFVLEPRNRLVKTYFTEYLLPPVPRSAGRGEREASASLGSARTGQVCSERISIGGREQVGGGDGALNKNQGTYFNFVIPRPVLRIQKVFQFSLMAILLSENVPVKALRVSHGEVQ